MCTVSFIKSSSNVIITSNRDEHIDRALALAPAIYNLGNRTLFYPKDPKGEGTWFASRPDGEVLVLLNGGPEAHTSKPPYRKSRGLIVLDLIGASNPLDAWQQLDLHNIEPFTLVYFSLHELYQLRWDGLKKSTTKLDTALGHIWSSSTLYSHDIRNERKRLFDNFTNGNYETLSPDDMIHFHNGKTQNTEDKQNGFIINRNQTLLTKSITQYVLSSNEAIINHHDLMINLKSQLKWKV